MTGDVELWKEWNKNKTPQNLEKLIKKLDPLIQAEVNRRSGTLARPLLETRAKTYAVRAIQSYNPTKGAKLSTHVTNQLQKLSRVNYTHQNAPRIPEHSLLQWHTYNVAIEDFQTNNGREPTATELADELKWSPRKVEQFQNQFNKAELLESKETASEMFVPYQHNPSLDYAYHSLSPLQQKIFEYTTGYNGAPILKNNTAIMRKLNITQGQLSHQKTKIKKILKDVQ